MAKVADSRFSVTTTTKERVPALPFLRLKKIALGSSYDLSLVFVGDKLAQTLNKKYRGKTYIPNVLSFPINKTAGEIFIDLKQAQREHRSRGESFDYFVALLFIHGMLHLKGSRHGVKMESEEQELLSKFNIVNRYR